MVMMSVIRISQQSERDMRLLASRPRHHEAERSAVGIHDSGIDRDVQRLFLIGRRLLRSAPYHAELSLRW